MKFFLAIILFSFGTQAFAQWNTNGTNVYYNAGNVGIGTSTPAIWFGGAKAFEFSDTRPTLKLTSTSSTGLSTIVFTNTTVNGTTHNGELHANYEFNATDNSKSILRFNGYPAGNILTLQADGKVGIGTLSPNAKFEIAGGDAAIQDNQLFSFRGGLNNQTGIRFVEPGDELRISHTRDGYDRYISLGSYEASSNNWLAQLSLNTKTGNVGIGTTAATSKLHIKSVSTLSSVTATPVNDLLTLTLNTPDGFVPAGTEARVNFKLQDWSNAEGSYGALGIEKESDGGGVYGGGKLKFYSYAPARGASEPSPGLINTFSIDRFGNTSILATMNYQSIPLSNTILKLRFHAPDVFVPYGMENRISFVTKSFNNTEDEIGTISVRVGDAKPSSYGGGELLFYTKDSSPGGSDPGAGLLERMRIDCKGRIGIGTNSPDAALTVKGDVHTREVRVDLTGSTGPDYVFEKNYNLIPLAELETYINQNKHLPEVPSAKEMENDGLNLKEMNLLLLKKVEELTLHIIRQEKRIDYLEQENNDLRSTLQKK